MRPETAPEFMLGFVVVFFGFLALVIYLRHRTVMVRHQERMLAFEKGIAPPPAEARPAQTPRVYLLRGLQWFFVGLSVSVMLFAMSVSSRRPISLESRLSEARYLRAQGASDDEVRQYMKSAVDEMEGMPYSVTCLGFVPMAVGVAYLIFYRKESQRAEAQEAK